MLMYAAADDDDVFGGGGCFLSRGKYEKYTCDN
jgi:hypothetical protein